MINIIAEIVLADGVIDVALDDEVMPSFKSRGSAFSMATVAAGTWGNPVLYKTDRYTRWSFYQNGGVLTAETLLQIENRS